MTFAQRLPQVRDTTVSIPLKHPIPSYPDPHIAAHLEKAAQYNESPFPPPRTLDDQMMPILEVKPPHPPMFSETEDPTEVNWEVIERMAQTIDMGEGPSHIPSEELLAPPNPFGQLHWTGLTIDEVPSLLPQTAIDLIDSMPYQYPVEGIKTPDGVQHPSASSPEATPTELPLQWPPPLKPLTSPISSSSSEPYKQITFLPTNTSKKPRNKSPKSSLDQLSTDMST
ncbi:hypothetical protein K474DRAFT_1680599 [Panus rudis PR-1116 ss-1]|nr:hypothetical protein K474DRAFT_1680599 [Panus rudis PR-1116 ss-1]